MYLKAIIETIIPPTIPTINARFSNPIVEKA
jgi:hypothetical protein